MKNPEDLELTSVPRVTTTPPPAAREESPVVHQVEENPILVAAITPPTPSAHLPPTPKVEIIPALAATPPVMTPKGKVGKADTKKADGKAAKTQEKDKDSSKLQAKVTPKHTEAESPPGGGSSAILKHFITENSTSLKSEPDTEDKVLYKSYRMLIRRKPKFHLKQIPSSRN
jgi:hypothetical protein